MNYTTNFNLNKPEGTDLYNHLTVDNPNMDTIDTQMQANKLASVGAATELVSGTVHAITRSDSNQNIFKFKATGDFKAGDTITVDGVSVNAYTTNGQQLLNDAYVLSAEVLCILDGTSLWVLANKTPDASEVSFDNTGTGIPGSDTESAIKYLEANKLWTSSFNHSLQAGIVNNINLVANVQQEITVHLPSTYAASTDYSVVVDFEFYGTAGSIKHIIRSKYAGSFIVRIVGDGNMNNVSMNWLVTRNSY